MNINEFRKSKYLMIVHASILQSTVRKSQGKSVPSYILTNMKHLNTAKVHRATAIGPPKTSFISRDS